MNFSFSSQNSNNSTQSSKGNTQCPNYSFNCLQEQNEFQYDGNRRFDLESNGKEKCSLKSSFDRKKEKETKPIENYSKSKFLGWNPVEEENQRQINIFCVCCLESCSTPTRNVRINQITSDLDYLSMMASKFGELQNIDVCNFPNFVTFSFFDLNGAKEFHNFFHVKALSGYSNTVEYISPLNQYEFIDYIIVNELEEEYKDDAHTFFSLFGEIYDVMRMNDSIIIKFTDLRTIQQLSKTITNFKKDEISQLKVFKAIFHKYQTDFFKNILGKTTIFSLENSTDYLLDNLIMKNERCSSFDSEDKENLDPSNKMNHPKNPERNTTKKSLKITSENFRLSEIQSVNDVEMNFQNSKDKKKNEKIIDYTVDLERIMQGNERRTTIMIRNIPNRYTQESLLKVIDVKFQGQYDFFYLPMDFKNKCNIGYAFINFISSKCIVDFYNEFHDKRWDLLRSEKICCVCFARIQGRNSLIKHFKKSNVIHLPLEKDYKPLILPKPFYDPIIF